MLELNKTALLLMGFQNDYFSEDGILYGVVDEPEQYPRVLDNTITLLKQWIDTPATLIATPVTFTSTYAELPDPVGLLKTIKEKQAFKKGSRGVKMVEDLVPFRNENQVLELEGRQSFNAFANTQLDTILQQKNIQSLVLAGAATAICIDSTARAAHERGYEVCILSDCIISRTALAQEFYVETIFPLYAEVVTSSELT